MLKAILRESYEPSSSPHMRTISNANFRIGENEWMILNSPRCSQKVIRTPIFSWRYRAVRRCYRFVARTSPNDERMVLIDGSSSKGLEWDTVFRDASDGIRRFLVDTPWMMMCRWKRRGVFRRRNSRLGRNLILLTRQHERVKDSSFAPPSIFLQELPPYLTERIEVRDLFDPIFASTGTRVSWGRRDDFYQEKQYESTGTGTRRGKKERL